MIRRSWALTFLGLLILTLCPLAAKADLLDLFTRQITPWDVLEKTLIDEEKTYEKGRTVIITPDSPLPVIGGSGICFRIGNVYNKVDFNNQSHELTIKTVEETFGEQKTEYIGGSIFPEFLIGQLKDSKGRILAFYKNGWVGEEYIGTFLNGRRIIICANVDVKDYEEITHISFTPVHSFKAISVFWSSSNSQDFYEGKLR